MPHVLVSSFNAPSTPIVFEDITFKFVSQPYKNGGVVGVWMDGYDFLLKFIIKKNSTIIKYDKTTRPPQLNIIKKAINGFCKITNSIPIQSNTAITKENIKYKNHKEHSFFINGLDYSKEIWLEIGFGSGRHLLHNAQNNPNIIHIGLEIHKPSIEQVLKQCKEKNIDNIYINDSDARIFLEMLPSNSIKKIFVHFPVPWNKAPHRRVFSSIFINDAITVLKKNGSLELRTDSKSYMDYTYSLFLDLDSCDIHVKKNSFLEVSSKYEDRWKKEEKDFYDLDFTNHILSEEKEIKKDFSFKQYISFKNFIEILRDKPIIEKDFLINIKEKYPINKIDGLVKIVIGAYSSPQPLFLLFLDNKISYYPKTPYPTRANFKAHKKLKALINNDNS